MALPKLFQRIFWHNNTTPAINEDNLNAMSKAIDDIDNRVIVLGDDVITVIPQIQAYLDQAEDLVEAMELLSQNPPYIGQNGNWWVWDTNTSAFVDSGVDASISVNIEDITMLAPDAAPYVTNSGTDTDPIFHLYIPRGQTGNGISTIAKTGTSGLVDTYTITMTDGTTSTFTVTNGSGDMNKSVYDPTNAIANAGGMKSAAAKNSTNAVTANSTDLVESGAVYSSDKGIYEVMGQNGAKNLLPFDTFYNGSKTFSQNGVNATITENGITFSGRSTGGVYPNSKGFTLKSGTYILSCEGFKNTGFSNFKIYKVSDSSNLAFIRSADTNEYVEFTINSDVYVRTEFALNSSGVDISGTAKPMIRLASDTDPTYQPYAKTNRQLTDDSVTWDNLSEVGAVNYLPKGESADKYNTHYTVNADGTISVTTGTGGDTPASSNNGIYKDVTLKAGTYKLSGCPSGGGSKYYISIESLNVRDTGNGAIFTIDSEQTVNVTLARINNTTDTYNGLVFKPMITPVSYNGPYVPYAMTNRELTDINKYEEDTTSISGVKIMKRNNVVTVKVNGSFNIVHNHNYVVGQLPERFRPPMNVVAPIVTNEGTPKLTVLAINSTGQIEINGYMIATSGTYPFDGIMTFVTNK